MNDDSHHEGAILEDIQHKIGQVLEATEALADVPAQLRTIEARLDRVEEQVALIPAIKAAVTDTNEQLRDQERRITQLEQAA
jgi:hypothetical protein